MFSSNQVLQVSGDLEQLETALEFALKYSGHAKNMLQEEIDRGCKLLYQITKDGKYCIGWGFEKVPEGWMEYPFKFEVGIVSSIIYQHLEKFEIKKEYGEYSCYEKGFIMKCATNFREAEKAGIKDYFYCIVYFEPFTCFYSK